MTLLVGLILLAVFLGFALLMFLERLSALLALPMMAAAFLLIATVADIFQPPGVLETVRIEAHTEKKPVRSRFEGWTQVRLEQARILHSRAVSLADSLNRIEAAPDVAAARDVLQRIREGEDALRREFYEALNALPNYFAAPPHHPGQRQEFDDAFNAMAVSDKFAGALRMLNDAQASPESALERVRDIARGMRGDSDAFLSEHPGPPDPASTHFRVTSALTYLLHFVILTLRAGSLWLYATIIATMFGGMFALYVKNLRIAERMVYWTAEYAGERPFVVCLAVFVVTGLIFTSVGGLGTVIMLGTIILPILRSIGLGPVFSTGVFLIAISMGGTLQPVSRRLWLGFYGLPPGRLDSNLWTLVGLYFLCGLVWMYWGTRRRSLSNFCSQPADRPSSKDDSVPARLMVAPLIPVALVYFGGIEEITAFTVSIVYMYLCVCRRPGAVRVLSRSLIEGAQAVMPPVLLMVGIGILLVALRTAPVQGYLTPLLAAVVPASRLGYITLFALAAPLALYRGPLNVWGMGLAVSGILLAGSSLPPEAILCAILATGMLQSVCDPTNTANVWIAGFQGVTVNRILRATIVPVWLAAIIAVIVFGFRFVPPAGG